ncbi:hypothetical protein OG585_22660 [Streptomyces sp. NBC_01340]|uniref:hypothetical protein n=1 Tax=Streptomyces sp. NBC_01340 TaxID=2903830 RepID=UPI002E10A17D|nr:hypothetical protein OG585_22660 [Streptomyces sp. NBC_01340]
MINESALLESKSLRDSVLEQTDVLDRVKALSLLPDGMHVTTAMVAAYFGVTAEAIRQLKARHPGELASNGMVTLQGAELAKFREPGGRRHLSLLVVGRCPSGSAADARAERDEYAWPRPADP